MSVGQAIASPTSRGEGERCGLTAVNRQPRGRRRLHPGVEALLAGLNTQRRSASAAQAVQSKRG